MKKFTRIMTIVLSLAVIFSAFAITASAASTNLTVEVEVTKVITLDTLMLTEAGNEYMALPNATFNFQLVPGEGNADGSVKAGVALTGNTTSITVGNDTNLVAGKNTVTETATISASGTFTTPGVYRYVLTELDNLNLDYVEMDDSAFEVLVYVGYIDGSYNLEIKAIVSKNADGEKQPPEFNNTVTSDRATASKTVTGNMGNKEKEFSFTIKTFENDQYEAGVELGIKFSDGTYDTIVVGTDYTFTMKHGESIEFDLPVGLRYTVEEENYSALDNGNGGYITTVNGEVGRVYEDVADGNNAADFINEKNVTTTGVFMSYAPYIAIIAVALAGIVIFMISKKRKASEA